MAAFAVVGAPLGNRGGMRCGLAGLSQDVAAETTRTEVGLRSERGPVLIAVMLCTALVALDATIIATAVPSIVERPRRLRAVPVAVLDLPADPGGDGAALRQARRRRRPQAGDVLRHRACSCSARCCAASRGACRRSSSPGRSRASAPARSSRWHDDHRRPLHGGGAGPGPGLRRQRVGHVVGRRPDARRRVLRVPVVALDLLHQPAARRARRLDARARNFHEQVERRRHRIDYAGAVLLTTGCSLLILGLLEGGVAWALGVADQRRASSRVGARAAGRVRAGRAAGGRADPAAVGVPAPRAGRRQPRRRWSSARC